MARAATTENGSLLQYAARLRAAEASMLAVADRLLSVSKSCQEVPELQHGKQPESCTVTGCLPFNKAGYSTARKAEMGWN